MSKKRTRRGIGVTRYRLAELLCRETGALIEAHNIEERPKRHIAQGASLWIAWGVKAKADGKPVKVQVTSWDSMGRCVKHGIDIDVISPMDFEVTAKG